MSKQPRRTFLKQAALAAGAVAAAQGGCVTVGQPAKGGPVNKPNFIVFLTDDQGYGDLSCMGAPDLRTPHLDALATSGVRFTDWYSNSPVCSPSRAALLTGRYPANAGVRAILAGHRTATGLPRTTPTLATALKPLGYQTAMFGKWHLGVAEESRPHNHGFDEWFGFMAGCIDYYSHIFYWGMANGKEDPVHDLWHNNQEIYDNGRYFTEMITERAVDYVRRAAKAGRPFFLYVPYNAPHYPMHAPKKYLDRFPDLPGPRRIMAAMLSAVDDSVGAILDEVRANGVLDNTCVFFTSDNGPSRETRNWLDGTRDPYYGGTAGALKGHKFSLYDGGIRMPALLSWPAHVPARQVVNGVAASMDVFPTFLKAAGGNPETFELDGRDIFPMIAKGAPSPHDAIFWEMDQQTAVRRGKWKLVLNGQTVEGTPPEDDVHLSDLDAGMAERINLKTQFPEIAAELTAMAREWRDGIEHRWKTTGLPRSTGTTTYPLEGKDEG